MLDRTPVERTITDEIDERFEHGSGEDEDRCDSVTAERTKHDRKREQEDDFDIEHDEDHCDEEELHREAFRRSLIGDDAAFVR